MLSKTITLFLVRHCDYDNPLSILPGRLPVKLSAEGIAQAERLKKYFASKKIEMIFSSAVARCQQTSEIISDGKIPITYSKALLETLSAYQGYWEHDCMHFFSHRQELGGESNADIFSRMVNFLYEVDFKDNCEYIICSHGDPLLFLLQYLAGKPMLAEALPGEKTVTPEDYQPRGSIKPVYIKGKIVSVGELVTQEELSDES